MEGDRTKWDYLFDMKVIEFLNTVSFYKDKISYKNAETEQQMKKLKR